MSIFKCHAGERAERSIGWKLNTILERLQEINNGLADILEKEKIMSVEMDALGLAVLNNTNLDGSIIELLNGIAAQVTDTAGDKEKALELAAELNAKSEALASAIKANTPVVDEVPPE